MCSDKSISFDEVLKLRPDFSNSRRLLGGCGIHAVDVRIKFLIPISDRLDQIRFRNYDFAVFHNGIGQLTHIIILRRRLGVDRNESIRVIFLEKPYALQIFAMFISFSNFMNEQKHPSPEE